MNKKSKFSLCIQVNEIDGALDYRIEPPGRQTLTNGMLNYELEVDAKQRNQIKIHLLRRQGHQSHMVVKEMKLNNLPLNQLNLCSTYMIKETGETAQTYGYLDRPGTLYLNIHQSAVVHNYMLYF